MAERLALGTHSQTTKRKPQSLVCALDTHTGYLDWVSWGEREYSSTRIHTSTRTWCYRQARTFPNCAIDAIQPPGAMHSLPAP